MTDAYLKGKKGRISPREMCGCVFSIAVCAPCPCPLHSPFPCVPSSFYLLAFIEGTFIRPNPSSPASAYLTPPHRCPPSPPLFSPLVSPPLPFPPPHKRSSQIIVVIVLTNLIIHFYVLLILSHRPTAGPRSQRLCSCRLCYSVLPAFLVRMARPPKNK
jgi:hypothetical protein